jgi:hypothetical protein
MPALPQLYPYKAGPIEPVIMPGEIAGVWVNKTYTFYQVEYIEGIMRSDPIMVDVAAGAGLAAGASTGLLQLTILEMQADGFGQFRGAVVDDFTALLYQGRADQRHTTHQTVSRYDRFTELHDPDGHTGEFYVHEDDWAFVQATNPTDYALTFCRMAFWGFRYVCSEMPQFKYPNKLPPQWTRIPATAHL